MEKSQADVPKKIILRYDALPVTVINPDLAAEIGLNESIMLTQIGFWIKGGGEFHDECWWTYQSVREMQSKRFPYWSISTINRTANKLIEDGYLIEGNYNKKKYDKTRWFALNPNKLRTLKSVTLVYSDGTPLFQNDTRSNQNDTRKTQGDTRSVQNETTIPESLTESPTKSLTEEKDSSPSSEGAVSTSSSPTEENQPKPRKRATRKKTKETAAGQEAKTPAEPSITSSVQGTGDPEPQNNGAISEPKDSSAANEKQDMPVAEQGAATTRNIDEEAQKLIEQMPPSKSAARELNDTYQEVVRRALGKPGQPLVAGPHTGTYVRFFRGTAQKGEKGVGEITLNYQLSDNPMPPEEIIGFALWYRPTYKRDTIPTKFDTLRLRCDEFRALPDHDHWIELGQRKLTALLETGVVTLETQPQAAVGGHDYMNDTPPPLKEPWTPEEGKRQLEALGYKIG